MSGDRRLLVNEHEMADVLGRRGFNILDPERLSVAEIMGSALGAEIVCGVEGSHLVHGLFSMADSAAMLVIQPPHRFNNLFKDYTDCLGMRYAFVVAEPQDDGFAVDVDRLGRTLDLIENSKA